MESPHDPAQNHNPADTSGKPGDLSFDVLSKERHQHLFQRGLKWLGAGIILMAVSFGINFLLFHSDTSFIAIMYVLTTLGTACIIKGLADILGF